MLERALLHAGCDSVDVCRCVHQGAASPSSLLCMHSHAPTDVHTTHPTTAPPGCTVHHHHLLVHPPSLTPTYTPTHPQAHPSVLPFLVYIKSEAKHVERMAVRAKYMTLDPHKNKYVAHMANIRCVGGGLEVQRCCQCTEWLLASDCSHCCLARLVPSPHAASAGASLL